MTSPDRLETIVDRFATGDDELRLELLLDHARRLPPLPERLVEARNAGMNRVPECMTPVFLWVEPDPEDTDRLRLFIDVADEAPTVRGLMSIIIEAFDGEPAEVIESIPTDLLNRLGLQRQIRMQRAVGFAGILARIRQAAADARASAGSTSP